MKTLKKTLCLVLAVVMVVGVMVLPASAADYKDADEIEYKEAVAVLTAIGVLEGDNGSFYPERELTRAEACTIIVRMLGLDDIAVDTGVFSDTKGHWAAPAISVAYNEGVVKGVGGGKFDPDGKLTESAWATMLLRAMDKEEDEEFSGPNWEINVAKAVRDISLAGGLNEKFQGSKACTRDVAAALALTALVYTDSGVSTGTYSIKDLKTEGADAGKYDGALDNDEFASKAEALLMMKELYGGVAANAPVLDTDYEIVENKDITGSLLKALDKDNNYASSGTDAMGRPAHVYTLDDGDTVLTYAKAAANSVVISNKATQTNAALAKSVKSDATALSNIYVNGRLNNSTTLMLGDVVELYRVGAGVQACITRYTTDTVDGDITTRTQDGKEQVRIPGIVTAYTNITNVDGYEDLVKDDVVYTYTDNAGVIHIAKADSFNGTLESISSGKYTISGTVYQINDNAPAIAGLNSGRANFDDEFTFYTDANGFIIASKAVTTTQSQDYVLVDAMALVKGQGIGATNYVEARLVHMDGTTEIVRVGTVKMLKQDGSANTLTTFTGGEAGDGTEALYNAGSVVGDVTKATATGTTSADDYGFRFFSYSEDSGVYTLTEVVTTNTATIATNTKVLKTVAGSDINIGTGKVQITKGSENVVVNDKTVFVVVNEKGTGYDVFTGKNNVPNINLTGVTGSAMGIYYLVNSSNVATYVFVPKYNTNDTKTSGDKVFIVSTTPTSTVTNSNGTFYTYSAIINGDHSATVTVKDTTNKTQTIINANGVGVYTPTYENNVIVEVSHATNTTSSTGYTLTDGTLMISGNHNYACADSVVAFIVDEKGEITKGTAAELATDPNDVITVVTKTGDANTIDYLVVKVVDDGTKALSTLTVTGVTHDTGGILLTDTTKVVKDGNKYTVTIGATVASETYSVTVTSSGSAKVEYNKISGNDLTATAIAGLSYTEGTTADSISCAAPGSYLTVYFRVTAYDDTVAYYTVVLSTPSAVAG